MLSEAKQTNESDDLTSFFVPKSCETFQNYRFSFQKGQVWSITRLMHFYVFWHV